eukprot:CAMPEP_0175163154 /NCGR_PEP_ID=MMETSP0087-20121206/25576_1 /TAXON_ID=136419 /ORGANISM="Unknown Unknown, Strain D1" /LENGTH=308 /DNA_ID=CAMNT_0016451795 /DNA_START=144 /DNA_END=1070 /DNA_ORIENTATION=-
MASYDASQIQKILDAAHEVKTKPNNFSTMLANETLLMLFSKPSLRTRLSFEVGMTQLGGHAIYYPLDAHATLGGKESIEDFARVVSRYATLMMARVASRNDVRALAEHATIPVINALDDWGHPCQILADFQTMLEQPGVTSLKGLCIAFVGDINNNVTFDLMRGGALMGCHVRVAGPMHAGEAFSMDAAVEKECRELAAVSGGTLLVTDDPVEAVKGANFVYADSIMSYGIDAAAAELREKTFKPYQVTSELMSYAPGAKFLHCLPALRGAEVTEEVLDGESSVVYDQAENRLHAQKALMLYLRNKLD